MERLKFEEEAWNTRDPERISEGYADNIEMRDGTDFVNGRSELKSFFGKAPFRKNAYRSDREPDSFRE